MSSGPNDIEAPDPLTYSEEYRRGWHAARLSHDRGADGLSEEARRYLNIRAGRPVIEEIRAALSVPAPTPTRVGSEWVSIELVADMFGASVKQAIEEAKRNPDYEYDPQKHLVRRVPAPTLPALDALEKQCPSCYGSRVESGHGMPCPQPIHKVREALRDAEAKA